MPNNAPTLRRRSIRTLTPAELSLAHGGKGNTGTGTGTGGPCETSATAKTTKTK